MIGLLPTMDGACARYRREELLVLRCNSDRTIDKLTTKWREVKGMSRKR